MQIFFPLLALTTSFFIGSTSNAQGGASFNLHSSSFVDRQTLPASYTCDGGDRSPELSWSGAPAETKTYVLLMQDPDAPAGVWTHWLVYNIPAGVSEFPEGGSPGGARGQNSWGRTQYNGPCPPRDTIHRYIFTLFALDQRLPLNSGADVHAVQQAMQGHVLGKASILGVFGH